MTQPHATSANPEFKQEAGHGAKRSKVRRMNDKPDAFTHTSTRGKHLEQKISEDFVPAALLADGVIWSSDKERADKEQKVERACPCSDMESEANTALLLSQSVSSPQRTHTPTLEGTKVQIACSTRGLCQFLPTTSCRRRTRPPHSPHTRHRRVRSTGGVRLRLDFRRSRITLLSSALLATHTNDTQTIILSEDSRHGHRLHCCCMTSLTAIDAV